MIDLIKIILGYIMMVILGSLIILNVYFMINFNNKINSFIQKGPRFTANNGQELCIRIQQLEKLQGIDKECKFGVSEK